VLCKCNHICPVSQECNRDKTCVPKIKYKSNKDYVDNQNCNTSIRKCSFTPISDPCKNKCTKEQICKDCLQITSNFGSYPNNDWFSKNKSYSITNKLYEKIVIMIVIDKKCKTLTSFRTYDIFPKRPCNYFDTAITSFDISNIGSS